MRALAALGVVAFHTIGPDAVFGSWRMPLFFVLSGYLLGGILLECRAAVADGRSSGSHVLWAFYIRRMIRLFPPLFVAILLARVGTWWMGESIWWHLLHLTNIYIALKHGWATGSLIHLWSLNVEEQLCLLLPLVIISIPLQWMHGALVSLWVGGLAMLPILAARHLEPDVLLPHWLHSFSAGLLLALAHWRGTRAGTSSLIGTLFLLGLAAGLVLVTADMRPSWISLGPALAFDSGMALLVGGLAGGWLPAVAAWLDVAPLRSVGQISYGLYLYHLPIFGILERLALHFGHPLATGGAAFVLTLAFTLPAATLSWRWVEEPLLRLRSRFRYGTEPLGAPSLGAQGVAAILPALRTAATGPRRWP